MLGRLLVIFLVPGVMALAFMCAEVVRWYHPRGWNMSRHMLVLPAALTGACFGMGALILGLPFGILTDGGEDWEPSRLVSLLTVLVVFGMSYPCWLSLLRTYDMLKDTPTGTVVRLLGKGVARAAVVSLFASCIIAAVARGVHG